MKQFKLFLIIALFLGFINAKAQIDVVQEPSDLANVCMNSNNFFKAVFYVYDTTLEFYVVWQVSSDEGATWRDIGENEEHYQYDPYGSGGEGNYYETTLNVSNINNDIDSTWYRCIGYLSDPQDPSMTYGEDTTGVVSLYIDQIPPSFDVDPSSAQSPFLFYLDAQGSYVLRPSDFILHNLTDNCQILDTVFQFPQYGGLETHSYNMLCKDTVVFSFNIRVYDNAGNHFDRLVYCRAVDTIAPTFDVIQTSPDNPYTVYLSDTGQVMLTINSQLISNVSDNCSVADTAFVGHHGQLLDTAYFDCGDLTDLDSGYIRVYDKSGNYRDKIVYYRVVDTISPDFDVVETTPDNPYVIYLPDSGVIFITLNSQLISNVSDNCEVADSTFVGPDGTTTDTVRFDCDDVNELDSGYIRVYDNSGNYTDKLVYALVLDTNRPVIECKTDTFEIFVDNGYGYIIETTDFDPQVSGTCVYNLTNSFNGDTTLMGDTIPSGTTVVNWVAFNDYGSDTCQTVFIIHANATVVKDLNKTVKIYPNPLKDQLYINISDNVRGVKLILLNSSGKIMMYKNLHKSVNRLDLQWLDKGVYILKIIKPTATETFKIIKQ